MSEEKLKRRGPLAAARGMVITAMQIYFLDRWLMRPIRNFSERKEPLVVFGFRESEKRPRNRTRKGPKKPLNPAAPGAANWGYIVGVFGLALGAGTIWFATRLREKQNKSDVTPAAAAVGAGADDVRASADPRP